MMAHVLDCPSLYREERQFQYNGRQNKPESSFAFAKKFASEHLKTLRSTKITELCAGLEGKDRYRLQKYQSFYPIPSILFPTN